jgi:NADH:ubiquinone oxidoreductase subunit E
LVNNNFEDNTAQDMDLEEIFSHHEVRKDELLPVLEEAQKKFGFLSDHTLKKVSHFMKVPESRVYAVATFYSEFKLVPSAGFESESARVLPAI